MCKYGKIFLFFNNNVILYHLILHYFNFRLMQATGMDSYNAFPYVRAALIGHATQDRFPGGGNRVTRRGNACAQLYKDCPTDSNSLLNYFNNHNGGLVNQVQPAVDNEVAPLIQAIIADVVGGSGSGTGSGPQTAASTAESDSFLTSDIFQGADALFTNAVINGATEAFGGGGAGSGGTGSGSGSSILETALGGGFDSLVDPIVDALIGRRRKK